MLEDDLLDGKAQLEEFGGAGGTVVGDAQAALFVLDEHAAQQQILHRLARRHAADLERGGDFGLGDAVAIALVAGGDREDETLLDLVGRGAAAFDRRQRRAASRQVRWVRHAGWLLQSPCGCSQFAAPAVRREWSGMAASRARV